MKQAKSSYRLTQTILKNLAKPRPERTEAEVFAGLSDEPTHDDGHDPSYQYLHESFNGEFRCTKLGLKTSNRFNSEACCECHLSKSEFREGPVLRCLRCQKALCFLCTGVHLDCRNRCEEAK